MTDALTKTWSTSEGMWKVYVLWMELAVFPLTDTHHGERMLTRTLTGKAAENSDVVVDGPAATLAVETMDVSMNEMGGWMFLRRNDFTRYESERSMMSRCRLVGLIYLILWLTHFQG